MEQQQVLAPKPKKDSHLQLADIGMLSHQEIEKRLTALGGMKNILTEAVYLTAPNCDNYNMHIITAQNADFTVAAMIGAPTQGQKFIFRFKDNGTARAITWNAIYRAMGTALPSTTVINKTLYLGFFYNATDNKWDLVAAAQEA